MSRALDRLRSAFTKLDREHAPLAVWCWTGCPNEAELGRQIEDFASKGVGGVVVEPREGLQIPHFGERWWDAVDYTIRKGQSTGLKTWIHDQSGSSSDVEGQSEEINSTVLLRSTDHQAKTLVRAIHDFTGPVQISLEGRFPLGTPLVQIVARLDKNGDLETDSFKNVTRPNSWSCPDGVWRLFSFSVKAVEDQVDYLRPQTVKALLESTYAVYGNRYRSFLGTDIPGVFFGKPHVAAEPLPWTDSLRARFLKDHGYDLVDSLPLLVQRAGSSTAKVRCDFYNTVGDMYEEAWFVQVSAWCERRGLKWIGHTEEHVASHPARQGDYFQTMRHLSIPVADHRGFRSERPRTVQPAEIKPAVSVAALAGRDKVMADAFGGAGWGVTPDELRHGANLLAAYGVDTQVLRGFFYSMDTAEASDDWPPSFSDPNPCWPHFKTLTEYITRLSAIVNQSKSTTSVGVLYPVISVAANTADGRPNSRAIEIAEIYEAVVDGLIGASVDVHLVDEKFVSDSRLEGGQLKNGSVTISTLILPPTPVIGRPAMRRMGAFARSGGSVICVGERPSSSSDAGGKDRSVVRSITDIFGVGADTVRGSKIGKGHAYEVTDALPDAIERIVEILNPSTSVASDADVIVVARELAGATVLLTVNRSAAEASATVTTDARGAAQIWNPETAEITQLDLTGTRGKREFTLTLPAHAARAIVFDSSARARRASTKQSRLARRKRTELKTDWSFVIADGTAIGQGSVRQLELPVLRTGSFSLGDGRLERLRDPKFDHSDWPEIWMTRATVDLVGNWRASWITGVYKHQGWAVPRKGDSHKRLRFRRSVEINEPPIKAWATFVGVDRATVYMNGTQLGESEDWTSPVTYNVMPYLKLGENTIIADVECESDMPISLLFESQIDLRSGTSVVLLSDDSWEVEAVPTELWSGCAYETDTPLVTWERGKPPIEPWGHLPLLGEQVAFPRTLMYRQNLPVGCVGVGIPNIKGDHKVYVDVRERQPDIHGIYNITTGSLLSVEIDATDFSNGIRGPLELYTRPTSVALKPWEEFGYGWYSGAGIYERSFDLTSAQADSTVTLDLGDVRHNAEVFVNDRRVGVRIWPPYEFDLTEYVQEGSNSLRVRVSNTLANEMRWKRDEALMSDPWHRYWHEDNIEKESLVSGLLGPVRVVFG